MTDILEDVLVLLDETPDQGCESPFHYDPPSDSNAHSEGGPLWYVNFTKQCHCPGGDIEIRCNSWALHFMGKEDKTFRCSCGGTFRVVVLEQINNS